MNSLNHFLTVASFLIFTLSAYGVIGLIFNAQDISPPKVFRGKWPLNEKPAIVILMITQGGLIVAGIFGAIGVIRRTFVLFYCPAFILLGIFASLSIFGGVCIRQSQRDISHEIFQAVQKNGNTTGEYFKWISDLQWEHECCGVKSYMDWSLFQFPSIAQHSVPYTCCIRNMQVPPKNCGDGVLAPNRAKTDIESTIFAKGCGPKISSLHSQTLLWLGIEMLVVGVSSLFVAAFLYFGVTRLLRKGHVDGANETTEHGSRERASEDNENNNRPPFSGNRRQDRSSTVSFADDVGNNNVADRRVPRFRSTSRNRSVPKTIRRHAGSGVGSKVRTARHCERKIAHQQHHSRKVCNPALLEAEMLFQLRDNHSTLSTTPYPSDAHSFINYFHQAKTTSPSKEPKPEPTGDSDPNLTRESRNTQKRSTLRALSHYSSLPQVYLVTPSASPPPDQRSKVMAELRQRLPPTLKNPGVYKLKSEAHANPHVHTSAVVPLLVMPPSPPPNQALHTQHHHYYRIPSPSVSSSAQVTASNPDPLPTDTTCTPIPEEDETPLPLPPVVKTVTFRESVSEFGSTLEASSQTTLSFRSEGSETFIRPTVFEVFGTESEPAVMQTEGEFLAGSSTTSVAAPEDPVVSVTLIPVQLQTEIHNGSATSTCQQDSLMEATVEGKLEPEPMDAMLYFNV